MVKPRIVNVVATADLKQPIDIVSAGRFRGFTHDSKKLGGRVVYFKSEEMRGRVAIFPNGKMISVGSVSLKDAIDDFMITMNALVSNKLAKPTILDATIQNIVATVDFERRIDLEYLSTKFGAIYEPEQFPGAICVAPIHAAPAVVAVEEPTPPRAVGQAQPLNMLLLFALLFLLLPRPLLTTLQP